MEVNLQFKDYESFKLDIDTNVKCLKKPNSRYFINSNSDSNIFMMDMYSLYQLSYTSLEKDIPNEIFNFSKILNVELSPNKFLSDFYLDRFFIINGDSVKLFDNNFLLNNSKNFDYSNNFVFLNSHLSSCNSNLKYQNNIFGDIKNFSLLNNQISYNKSTISYSSNNINPSFNLKNINNLFNKTKQTTNNNLFSNLTLNNNDNPKSNNNTSKNKIYERGHFVVNPNLIILNNKETVSLCDFRVYNFL